MTIQDAFRTFFFSWFKQKVPCISLTTKIISLFDNFVVFILFLCYDRERIIIRKTFHDKKCLFEMQNNKRKTREGRLSFFFRFEKKKFVHLNRFFCGLCLSVSYLVGRYLVLFYLFGYCEKKPPHKIPELQKNILEKERHFLFHFRKKKN